MLPTQTAEGSATAGGPRLRAALTALGCCWLLVLPILRPLIWSGQPTTEGNLFYLCLLAAATSTGVFERLLGGRRLPSIATTTPAFWLGSAFLLVAAVGGWRSPMPALAWSWWVAWLLHLATPLALLPVIRAHRGVAIIGLLVGLALECALLPGEVWWERPEVRALYAADPALLEHERLRTALFTRLGSWRLTGTFLLANTLAAYLVTVLPLAVGVAWSAWRARDRARWPLTLLALAAVAALVGSGSKAGMLALAVAVLIAALWKMPSARWRVALGAAAVALAGTLLLVPPLRHAAAASAEVRVEYWQAAAVLIAERPWSGHGLEGFHAEFPRVKLPAGEETIYAHNEVVQAAVDLGLPAAALLVAWCVALMHRLARTPRPLVDDNVQASRGALVMAAFLLAYAIGFIGVLGDWSAWPGGRWWAVAFVVAGVALMAGWRQVREPPAWAYTTGVLACLLHALADFHLHSPQVVGVLGLVAAIGTAGPEPAAAAPPPRWQALTLASLAVLALLATVAGTVRSALRGDVADRAELVYQALHRLRLVHERAADEAQRLRAQLALASAWDGYGGASPEVDPVAGLAQRAVAEVAIACRDFPADPELAALAVKIVSHADALAPAAAAAFTAPLREFAARWPSQVMFSKILADHYQVLAGRAAAGDAAPLRREAQRWAERTVALYPTHLPFREELIALARANGDDATVVRETETIARLAPLVHSVNAASRDSP